MARANEKESPHQLEYLDHRLTCTRYVEGTFKWKYGFFRGRWRKFKKYIVENHPVGLNYFTVRQLLYIINDIRENYFRETHIFAFGQEKFLVKLLPDRDDEIGDYEYPSPRQSRREPFIRKQGGITWREKGRSTGSKESSTK